MARTTRKLPPDVKVDINAMRAIERAMRKLAPRMRRTTLEYFWDKYVTHADKVEDVKVVLHLGVAQGA